MRITITAPLWHGPRTGTARPAFGRGRYHVTLDGEPRKAERTYRVRPCPMCTCATERNCTACSGKGKVFEDRLRELLFTRDEMVREDGGQL